MARVERGTLCTLHSADRVQTMAALILLLSLLTSPALCRNAPADLLFSITEEQSIGTYIGAITDNRNLYKNLTLSQRSQLKYGLLNHNRYPAFFFRVDESSGRIYVANRIDRESEECYQQPTCVLEFNVALSSSRMSFSNIATVIIKVADKNDNPPYFPSPESGSVVLDVSEFASVGTAFKLSGAEDSDFDYSNVVQRYTLSAYTNVFSIKSSTNTDGSSQLGLTLLQSLDREVISSYRFSIKAFDGGFPPLSAALDVLIRVTDENDNAPVFLRNKYNLEIQDRVNPGQVILKVSAMDMDSGEHGKVRYKFSRLEHQQLEQTLHVDEVTGKISVVSDLSAGIHQFIVEAWDGGSPPLKSQTLVRMKVISSENSPPSLEINTLSNGNNSFLEIPEDAEQGAFVAFVTAEDKDEGTRGDIICYLICDVFNLEVLTGKGYTLTLHKALDREAHDLFNITVTCSDKGHPPLSTSKSLQVIITDVNDNPPKFRWDTFSHIVPEGNYSNRHVIQVTATDPDMGKNAELIYSIDNSAHPLFRIDPMSGIISATGQLDRETTPFYTFKVYATDRGQSPNTASAKVIITLEDINDQYPTFNKSIFEFRISENARDRTLLGTLSAYDYDKGSNGKCEFFHVGSLNGADHFAVTADGKIWTSGELDREQRDSYSFTVMVRDKGLPPKITYASVLVTILDVNDNAPRIQFPVSADHTIHVSTVPESGMVLAKIVAYDPDAAENGSLHFVVLYGNEDGALDIDPTGGEVKVTDVSKLKNNRLYRLVVGVQDYGSPPLSSNTTILVDVNFDNSSGALLTETDGENKVDDYVMIVAGVAVTTVVLSAIIIGAICVFSRQGQQYRDTHPTGSTRTGINDDGEFFSRFSRPHGNLCDDEKISPCLEEKGDEKNEDQTTSFNEDDDDDCFKMKQLAMETFRNTQHNKEVSLNTTVPMAEECVSEVETQSSMSNTYCNVRTVPRIESGEKADSLKRQHQFLPRQVDNTGSDTSGDTGASDSGRGGCEGDVNTDHILRGERDLHQTRVATSYIPSRDSVPTSQTPRSTSITSSRESAPTNQRTFSPSVQSSPVTFLFTPRATRKGTSSSSAYKNVLFTPLSQNDPQKTLSTFSLSTQPQPQNGRGSSLQSGTTGNDGSSRIMSSSYTAGPGKLQMDGCTGSDINV